MRGRSTLVESQIARARASGALDNLRGEGKPLPRREIRTGEDELQAVAMGVMAEAGVIPEEFAIKTALADARAALADLTDPDARKQQLSQIAGLELRYNIAVEARRKFLR